jgi:hypothetical protein
MIAHQIGIDPIDYELILDYDDEVLDILKDQADGLTTLDIDTIVEMECRCTGRYFDVTAWEYVTLQDMLLLAKSMFMHISVVPTYTLKDGTYRYNFGKEPILIDKHIVQIITVDVLKKLKDSK